MAQLSYSFCMSLLHSLWQAGALVFLYWLAEIGLQQKFNPLQKKNLLYICLGIQAVLLITTFFIYYCNVENNFADGIINRAVSSILSADSIHAFTPWLFITYLLVITYKMIRTICNWYGFRNRFNAGIQRPSIDLKLFTALKAAHFGIRRKVQLWFSYTISTPLTFGFFKPVIVLPIALMNQLTIQQAESLILHELTHIKANDYLLNWFLLLAENLFFFNPFLLLICKKICLEREKYCDINVMAFEYAPLTYAETLLQAQYIKQNFSKYPVAAVSNKQELLQRIQFFTKVKNQISQKNNRLTFPLLTSLLLLFFIATLFFQYSITKKSTVIARATITPTAIEASSETVPDFVNNIIESLTSEKLKKIQAIVEKQQPAIEQQLKKLAPLIKDIQTKASAVAEDMGNNFVTPVAFKENDATRQVIVREEQSGSNNATVKVYTVSYINGKWVLQPEWKLASREIPLADSLRKIIDSTTTVKDQQTAY